MQYLRRPFNQLLTLRGRLRSESLRSMLQRMLRRLQLVQRQRRRNYATWIDAYDTLNDDDKIAIAEQVNALPSKPLISIVMPVYNSPREWLENAIESVRHQIYPHWQLCIADDASSSAHVREVIERHMSLDDRIRCVFRQHNGHISAASNSALDLADGEFIALVDHDDELPCHALYVVAKTICEHQRVDVLYTDENKIDMNGHRYSPQFKPAWDPELICATNYIAHLGVYRASLVRSVGGFREGFEGSQDYDLALRCLDETTADRIIHIPYILYHWRAIEGSVADDPSAKKYAYDAAVRALESHLKRIGQNATVHRTRVAGQYRIRYPLPQPPPSVAIVIPLAETTPHTSRCIRRVLQHTHGVRFAIVCVGTDRQCDDFHRSNFPGNLELAQFVHVADDATETQKINAAVNHVESEIICLLDPYTEVNSDQWLQELTSQASRTEVGMVGPKISSSYGTTLHQGFVISRNILGNHEGLGSAGAYFATHVTRNAAAVSGICMAIRRELIIKTAYFEQTEFNTKYFNIDLCLTLQRLGYKIVWTPYADVILHHVDRIEQNPNDQTPDHLRREFESLCRKWEDVFQNALTFNPNLELNPDGFELSFPPRIGKPWISRTH